MTSTPAVPTAGAGRYSFSSGVTAERREEQWLIAAAERAAGAPSTGGDSYLLGVRRINPCVADAPATFDTGLDPARRLDPSSGTATPRHDRPRRSHASVLHLRGESFPLLPVIAN